MNSAKKPHFASLLLSLMLLLLPQPAAANEEYVNPTYPNLVKMLIRFGAINIADDTVIDGIAMVEECKLYQHFYRNDFKWREVQAALRKSIRRNVETYPTGIYYNAELQLDRYDFKNDIFKFTHKTSLANVNLFNLDASNDAICGDKTNPIMPNRFQIILDRPMTLKGLPLSPEDAKTIFSRLEENGNKDHIIYVRFSMRVIYIARLERELNSSGVPSGRLRQEKRGEDVRLDSRLDSIDFYEDSARTKLIYTFRP